LPTLLFAALSAAPAFLVVPQAVSGVSAMSATTRPTLSMRWCMMRLLGGVVFHVERNVDVRWGPLQLGGNV
jgi:hypothetical protein